MNAVAEYVLETDDMSELSSSTIALDIGWEAIAVAGVRLAQNAFTDLASLVPLWKVFA